MLMPRPDADAPMIPDVVGPVIPGGAAPGSGWHLSAWFGIWITLF